MLRNHTTACKYAVMDLYLAEDENVKYVHYQFRDDGLIFYQSEIKGKFNSTEAALR